MEYKKITQRVMGEGGKTEWTEIRERKHERLLNLGNKLRVVEREVGGGWGSWVMGITEGT